MKMLPEEVRVSSRREFVRMGAAVAAAGLGGEMSFAQAERRSGGGRALPIRLGLCSYTFRNFTRQQMIGYMKQLNVATLNAKDAKDHLPQVPAAESAAVADYKAAGIRLHAAGAIYFDKGTDEDIRSKFEYCKRAGIGLMVAGDPTPEMLPKLNRFVNQFDIKVAIHNHGPEDKLWPSPLDVLKDIRGLDRRIGCCIDVGHTARTGTDVVDAIHKVGPRLLNMHMKDLTDFTRKDSQVAVGDGKMPVKEIFRALEAIRYPEFVDLEYEVEASHPMPGVIRSFAYMRGVLNGMGLHEG
jgi:hypothetical protein